MDTLKAIYTRHSIRAFADRQIETEKVRELLRAAMSGPCCVNAREWEFIVVTEKETLNKMAEANGRPAEPLKQAPLGVLICGNLNKAFKPAPEYWVIDCSAAIQNMTLAAHDMGLGSVWLGTWPQTERVENQRRIFNLPEHIIPHSVIAFGYPAEADISERDLYDESCVHWEKW